MIRSYLQRSSGLQIYGYAIFITWMRMDAYGCCWTSMNEYG